MKIICAWCNATLQTGTLPATHGICPDCAHDALDQSDALDVALAARDARRDALDVFDSRS